MFITLLLYKGAAGPVAAAAAGGRGAPDLGGQEDEDLEGPAGEDEDEDGQGPGAAEDEELQVCGGLGAAGEDALAPRPAPQPRQQENQVTRDSSDTSHVTWRDTCTTCAARVCEG